MNGIKSLYVNRLACIRVKRVRGNISKLNWYEARLYLVHLVFQCGYGRSNKKEENKDGKDANEISGGVGESGDYLTSCMVYADDLVLCGESKEDLK